MSSFYSLPVLCKKYFYWGKLKFVEACATGMSLGVGGTSSGAAMFISATELSLISGSYDASKYIIFESTQGSINLSSINQGNHLPNAQNPKIKPQK